MLIRLFGGISVLAGLLVALLGAFSWSDGGYWAVLVGLLMAFLGVRWIRKPETVKKSLQAIDAANQAKNAPAAANPDLVVSCPKCGSTQVVGGDKGFGLGKAAVGGVVTGSPIGLLGGFIGSKKAMVSCMNCGNRWEAGKAR